MPTAALPALPVEPLPSDARPEGLLDAAPRAPCAPCAPLEERPLRIVARAGASASIVERDGHEVVAVHDRAGRLLFEYDAETGRGSLVAAGGLSLAAPGGDIDLVAGGAIRCWAAGEVAIASRSGATLSARAGERGATVQVAPGRVTVAGEALAAVAERGDVRIAEARYEGRALTAVLERAHTTVGKIESIAGRVIARAGDLFQEVRELHQLRAGRVRALVEDVIELRGREVSVDAREDVSIDGQRINLG
ncbi:DUF3540 domain-containing protein [Sorangium sp. So ce295]|jgi:hypothetical protein|uniref:DUF3540 domain-containing protein n=1 Tax=Sorangium sp. So ce295 TaxID=3133295 RepID=UPI003F619E71